MKSTKMSRKQPIFPDYPSSSLDSSNDNISCTRNSLISKLNTTQLQEILNVFEKKNKILTRNEFIDTIYLIFGNHLHSVEADCLYGEIDKTESNEINRDQFLDHLINILNPSKSKTVEMVFRNYFNPAHAQEEPIQKIVIIQSEEYFCYCIITRYGGVGLYDVNCSFLSSYRIVFTKDDLRNPFVDHKDKRNRWVNECIFIPNSSMLVVTNSTRTLTFYDAARLRHYLIWMIVNFPYIIKCLCYSHKKDFSILLMGDEKGGIILLKFLNSKCMFRKKCTDKPNVFSWQEILEDKEYVSVIEITESHGDDVIRMSYTKENFSIASCSRNPKKSVIIQHVFDKWKPYFFKMKQGVNCFALDRKKQIMITGSLDGLIAIWNIFITSRPTKVLTKNIASLDLVLLENNLFLTFSEKRTMELVDINSESTTQLLRFRFPKNKRWGDNPRVFDTNRIYLYEKDSSGQFKDQYSEYNISEDGNHRDTFNWNLSHVFVVNSNYIANVHLKHSEKDNFTSLVLHPPPLHNSVLVPLDWKIYDEVTIIALSEERSKISDSVVGHELVTDVQEPTVKNANNIETFLNKHSAFSQHQPNEINWRLSQLENEKLELDLTTPIATTAFLRLKLQETQEMKLSPHLLKSENRKVRRILEKVSKLLENTSYRERIFYEESNNGRSHSQSSTSSVYELLT